jgi:NAD(P)-dependent dehydrogenase (short-subunit alcohol dehydrogenase family)
MDLLQTWCQPRPNGEGDDMADLFSLTGKTILITGATGAFGSASARELAAAGARLVLAGSDTETLQALVGELGADRAVGVAERPTSLEAVQRMVDAANGSGGLDGVVVASGTNQPNLIKEMTPEQFATVMDANVAGAWLVCKVAGTQLQERGSGGSIVLVSSVRGARGHAGGYSAYAASKGATDALTRNQAVEWGRDRIRVNAIAPTVFRSAVTAWMYDESNERGVAVRQGMVAHIPMGRLAEPEDFVGTVRYLLSDASAFVTGQVIYVDGGYTSW